MPNRGKPASSCAWLRTAKSRVSASRCAAKCSRWRLTPKTLVSFGSRHRPGLYRLRGSPAELFPVTAQGTLRPAPVRELGVDPSTGIVWMGIDAEGPALSASLVGYNPANDNIQNFSPDNGGLPAAPRIDTIDFTGHGDLVVVAAGRLVTGQLVVPASRTATWLAAILSSPD